jgi:hypothetical protein
MRGRDAEGGGVKTFRIVAGTVLFVLATAAQLHHFSKGD